MSESLQPKASVAERGGLCSIQYVGDKGTAIQSWEEGSASMVSTHSELTVLYDISVSS